MSETVNWLKSITFPTGNKYIVYDNSGTHYIWHDELPKEKVDPDTNEILTLSTDSFIEIKNPISGTIEFICTTSNDKKVNFGINYIGNYYNLLYISDNNAIIPKLYFSNNSFYFQISGPTGTTITKIEVIYYGPDTNKIQFINPKNDLTSITLSNSMVPQNPYSYIAIGTQPPTESTVGAGATIYLQLGS